MSVHLPKETQLTGRIRVRAGLFGRPVLQVEIEIFQLDWPRGPDEPMQRKRWGKRWRDASMNDLLRIGAPILVAERAAP